jgi:serine/threonine-protein kinase
MEAVEGWKRAVELVPDDPAKAEDLGITYFWMREYAEAKRCLDRTNELAPDIPHYWEWDVYLFLNWDGSTERARQALEEGRERLTPLQFALLSAELDKIDGDYEKALETLRPHSGSHEAQLEKASIYVLLDEPGLAIRQYDLALAILERGEGLGISNRVRLSRLGVAYAGLGRRQDAVNAGEAAVGLLPVSRDALSGTLRIPGLAKIYMMVGEYEAAIDALEELLSIPSNISVERLRIDPTWNPLRDHPRFQALLERYGDLEGH